MRQSPLIYVTTIQTEFQFSSTFFAYSPFCKQKKKTFRFAFDFPDLANSLVTTNDHTRQHLVESKTFDFRLKSHVFKSFNFRWSGDGPLCGCFRIKSILVFYLFNTYWNVFFLLNKCENGCQLFSVLRLSSLEQRNIFKCIPLAALHSFPFIFCTCHIHLFPIFLSSKMKQVIGG